MEFYGTTAKIRHLILLTKMYTMNLYVSAHTVQTWYQLADEKKMHRCVGALVNNGPFLE